MDGQFLKDEDSTKLDYEVSSETGPGEKAANWHPDKFLGGGSENVSPPTENALAPRKKIPRIGWTSRLNSESKLHKPTVDGLENLTAIPENQELIIATTHLSDIDMETAISTVSPYRDVSVASQSTHLENPIFGRLMRWATENEIYGVSSKFGKKPNWLPAFRFNPKDYEAMKAPLEKGRAMVIAAHRPTHEWELPDKPGLGAIYLAQISGGVILPTAVDVQYPEFIDLSPIGKGVLKRLVLGKRPDVKVTFGTPIQLTPIPQEEISVAGKFLNHDERHKMTADEIQQAKLVLEKLQLQGAEVMKSLANMLPQSKRGRWQNIS